MPDGILYFQLNDDIDPGAPFTSLTVSIEIPTMIGGEPVGVPKSAEISVQPSLREGEIGRIIPNSRVIESADFRLSNVLRDMPFTQIDKPAKKTLDDQAKDAVKHEEDNQVKREITGQQEETAPATGAVSVPTDVPTPEPAADGQED